MPRSPSPRVVWVVFDGGDSPREVALSKQSAIRKATNAKRCVAGFAYGGDDSAWRELGDVGWRCVRYVKEAVDE